MAKGKKSVVKRSIRNSTLLADAAILLLAAVIIGFVLYLNSEMNRVRNDTSERLSTVSENLSTHIKESMNSDFLVLNTFSEILDNEGYKDTDSIMEAMTAVCDATVFTRMWVIDESGQGFSQDGHTADFSARTYFQKAMNGQPSVERVSNSIIDNTVYFVLAVPIIGSEGDVEGVLSGSISEADFSALLDSGTTDNLGYCFICYSTGHIIVDNEDNGDFVEGSNITLAISNAKGISKADKAKYMEQISNQQSGTVSYTINGHSRLAVFSPLGMNNWVLVNVVPTEYVDSEVNAATRSGLYTTIFVLFACVTLIVMLLVVTGRQNRSLRNEYKRVRLSDERFRLAIDNTNVSIWDYDFTGKRIIQTENSVRLHGYDKVVENVPESLISAGYIYPESADACRELYKKLENGDKKAEAVLKVRSADGSGYWYEHVRYTSITGLMGKPIRAIGVSEDVTEKYEAMYDYEREIKFQQVLAPDVYTTALFDVTESLLVKMQFKFSEEDSLFKDATFTNYFSIAADRVKEDDSVKSFLRGIGAQYLTSMHDQKQDTFSYDYLRRMADDTEHWVHEELHLMIEPDTEHLMLFLCVRDVDTEKKRIDKLSLAAESDAMTGLLNHEVTLREISRYLDDGGMNCLHALFMVDIDYFKGVNDTIGHQAGDKVIGMVSGGIKNLFRADDIIGRMGGDEFLVLMKDVPSVEAVKQKAAELVECLQFSCSGGGNTVNVTASIGVVVYNDDGSKSVAELYKLVDEALYSAKSEGRNRFHLRTGQDEISGIPSGSKQLERATTIQLQAIMENIDGSIFVVEIGETLRPLYISPSFFKTAGAEEAKAVREGASITSFIHPDEMELFESECRKYAASGEPWDYTYRVCLSKGAIGWRHGRAVTIPYESSEYPVMIDIVTDVTDIMQTSNKLDAILNNSPVGIAQFTLGSKARVTFANNEFIRMCGVPREVFDLTLGADLSSILTDDEKDTVLSQLNSTGQTDEVLEYIHKYTDPVTGDIGFFSVRSMLLEITSEGEKSFLSIVLEVTDKIRLERELAESRRPAYIALKEDEREPERKPAVLVVDDSKINRVIVRKIISDSYVVLEAENGFEALGVLRTRLAEISAVLLDLIMPVMDGIQFLNEIRKDDSLKDVPVIVLTGSNDIETETRVLEAGAWDYIVKPLNPDIVMFRLKNVILRSEMTAFNRLKYLADYDELTGVFNRSHFFAATREMLLLNPDDSFALIRFDINRFGLVNTYYGLEEGDKVLRFLAEEMTKAAKRIEKCTFGRIESDVFGVCVKYIDTDQLESFFTQTKRILDDYGLDFDLIPAFGVYLIVDPEMDIEQMFDNACLAAKRCKGSYLNNYCYYGETMSEAVEKEQEIVNRMGSALEAGQFEIYLQPKVNIRTEIIEGSEALVRWIDPQRGIIPPSEFIPVFESNGFITKLDYYVWEETCKVLRRWLDEGRRLTPISVNVSRVNLYSTHLLDSICALTDKYDIPRRYFNIELTESAYMDNQEAMSRIIDGLRSRGYTVMMDDFGSGFSSLNALKDIPVDVLKIDQRFLSSGRDTERGKCIIRSVVEMAKELDMAVIAEGVEKRDQVEFLRSIGCDFVQGFYYARPMPVEDFEKRL